jgi:hypothetical protein
MELQGSEPPSLVNFSTPSLPTLANVRSVKSRGRHLSTSLIWIWNSIWRGKQEVWREPLIVGRSKISLSLIDALWPVRINILFQRYHLPSTIHHIPYCTHRSGNFDGVRYFSTSLVNSLSQFFMTWSHPFRHTNLDGILLLLLLWRW